MTIKMLITLEGRAEVAGHDIVREPRAVRRHIGYVSQLLSADGGLTGYENLMLSARLSGIRTGRISAGSSREFDRRARGD